MGNGNLLFESVFQRKLSAAGTREFLTDITKEHPYFSTAHFFLLLASEKSSPAYPELAAKTSLLFNNPYWLQFQLQEKDQLTEIINAEIISEVDAPTGKEDAENFTTRETGFDPAMAGMMAEDISDPGAPAVKGPDPAVTENIPPLTKDAGEEPIQIQPTENVINQPELIQENETTIDEIVKPDEPIATENLIRAPDHVPEISAAEAGILPSADKSANQSDVATPVAENEADRAVQADTGQSHAPDIRPSTHFNNDSSPLVNEADTEEEIEQEKEMTPFHFKLNIETPATAADTVPFEPLHTSDYFASQGIKLSGEIKPSDKLGKQLKSFTEWLKTMKKIHTDQLEPLSGQADMSIQKLAEQSNKDDAVVTEAMAEVLVQQGKVDKAIELYKKLSLINPSKSTYFAAKIDQLKEQ